MSSLPGAEEDVYVLARDNDASFRLSGQHFLLATRNGWLIHPAIEQMFAGQQVLRIADVATGNGIWAASVAAALPKAVVVGLDISDLQYPPAWGCPKNLSFAVYNMLQPPPVHLTGSFDVVHVRLIAGGMRNQDDFVIAIEHLAKLLKPGGFLQWQEVSFPTWLAINSSLIANPDMHDCLRNLDRGLGGRVSRYKDFPLESIISQNIAFEIIKAEIPAILPWLVKYETDSSVATMRELIRCVKDAADSSDAPQPRNLELLEKAQKDIETYLYTGGFFTYGSRIIITRKK